MRFYHWFQGHPAGNTPPRPLPLQIPREYRLHA